MIPNIFQFLDKSPSAFHATANACKILQDAGYQQLDEASHWQLKPGKGYFVTRNQSSVIAFQYHGKTTGGFRLVTGHTDSPAPKLKLAGASFSNGSVRVPVQLYGGDIHTSWLDRPLGVAGRIAFLDAKNQPKTALVNINRPVAVIPNLAIHLNHGVNNGLALNPQSQMAALFGGKSIEDLINEFAKAAKQKITTILDAELFLYDIQPATIVGLDNSLISSPRLDNLTSCHAAICGLLDAKPRGVTPVIFLADNEEIGSRTPQGAMSTYLHTVMDRITLAAKGTQEDTYRAMAASSMLSIDSAHAIHPNYPEKHDSAYAPKMNQGIVVKHNADFKYATTSESATRFRALCKKHGIKLQDFVNRSDMPCGSTIGPMCAAELGVPGLDIGSALWAMHSCREIGGLKDHEDLIKAAQAFLSD
ncbi:MAG: M18 family aminopeptidase [Victivallales bacterium]|nr:M18 family aminopeptidase [Victivallales bacterium]